MAAVHTEKALQVARKTLGRDEHGERPPEYYFLEVSQWLQDHPDDDNFLTDLFESPPVVTCLDCFEDFSLSPSPGHPVGLRSFERHTNKAGHMQRVRDRIAEQERGHESDGMSLHSHHSSASASIPNTPDTGFGELPDVESKPFTFNSEAAPWNNAGPSDVKTGKKRVSDASADSYGPIEISDDEDHGRAYKRTRMSPDNDDWATAFDVDNDISMMDIPPDFWAPVVPKEEEKPVVLNAARPKAKKRPSAVLAALDGLTAGPSTSKRPAPPSLVKPEPIDDVKPLHIAGHGHVAKRHMKISPPPVPGPSRIKPEAVNNDRALLAARPLLPNPALNVAKGAAVAKHPAVNMPPAPPAVPPQPVLSMPGAFPPMLNPLAAMQAAIGGVRGLAQNAYEAVHGMPFRLNADMGPAIPGLDEGGPEQAVKLNEFFTQGMDDLAETEGVQDALKKLDLSHLKAKLPGMEVSLLPHQVIGVAWANKLELGSSKGGILADDMGLGKTVQMIATMCLNRPTKEDAEKSTLIIVPTALLEQWRAEIQQKTVEDTFSVFVHHGSNKLKRVKDVRKYDIVITTYATLGHCFAKLKKERGKKAQDYIDDEERKIGPLAKTTWWRIILDEAQFIRNRLTTASINVSSLDAVHRWSLTGTPVTNTLTDLYALIRFGRHRPWNDFEDFNNHVGKIQLKRPDLAGKRAQALLKPILLRRTKDSMVEGKPIIELGPKTITVHQLEFTPREREVYEALEKRQQDKLQRMIDRGRVVKEYHFILVMILRLRQAANHIQLITYAADEFGLDVRRVAADGSADENTPEEEHDRAMDLLGSDAVTKLKQKYLELAKDNDVADEECSICLEPFAGNRRVTKCGHEFCADCIKDVFNQPYVPLNGAVDEDVERADAAQLRPCPVCRANLKADEIFNSLAFEPSEEELAKLRAEEEDMDEEEAEFLKINAKRNAKGKGKAKTAEVNGIDLAELDLGSKFKPSTKMTKMLEFLKEYQNNPTDGRVEKTILYSQWTSMIDLIEILLKREGLKSVRYDGKMTRGARDKAIAAFKSDSGPNIMIISLKCGGVGLNLTEASRVISLDLAWNSATENQAFDRVHRLGQQRDVFIERLVVKNTIEDRILGLQKQKQGLSDAALGEGTGEKLRRLGVRELRQLFGMA
ncbi:hypothetical protein EXIGLDRAFT_733361 [Exidia glandulosa HHB12029]|uniref:P-loop containing nucleoside triphosphate hydrolase protein n=1 Tax=Exidia glandulosa HHB12029 TaxID=1314781 RepID=A0A165KJR4_EXIGL|nr:hypothetical protein EXIGLDRAFT_733361 [Exidia glandulosa HHB12029]